MRLLHATWPSGLRLGVRKAVDIQEVGMQQPVPPRDDRYARESFTWRRMKGWQVWTMSAIVIVLILLALFAW